METTTIIFTIFSILMIGYIIYSTSKNKKISLRTEIFFILIYITILLLSIFPQTFDKTFKLFGITNTLDFITYTSLFIIYAILFHLYKKSETQRQEITNLTRHIAYLKHETKKNKNKQI